jgi:nitrite reductase (NO-forming)
MRGPQEFSLENLLAENPQHLMFNDTLGALTKMHTMGANAVTQEDKA